MPMTRQRKTYSLAQLKGKARKNAIEKLREQERMNLDTEHVSYGLRETLSEIYGLDDMSVYWSLNYCQGDGVAFEGRVDFDQLYKHNADFREVIDPHLTLQMMPGGDGPPELHITIEHHGNYYHECSMNVEVEGEPEAFIDPIYHYLKEKVKEISCELRKDGYAEIEYLTSEEHVALLAEDLDWKFYRDGEIAD